MSTDRTPTTEKWRRGLQMRLGEVWMWRWAKVRCAFAKRKWREAYNRGRLS